MKILKIINWYRRRKKNLDFISNEEDHNENKNENEDILEYNSEDVILEDNIFSEDDNNISLLINELSLEDNNNSIETKSNFNKDKDGILNMNGQYKNDLKLPLMERIKKNKEYKNLCKDKKPTKTNYIYPKVDLEYENDDNESNAKQKRKGWVKRRNK